MELQLSRSAGSHGAPAWCWHRKVLVKVSENFIIAPPSEKCRAACNTQGKGQRRGGLHCSARVCSHLRQNEIQIKIKQKAQAE